MRLIRLAVILTLSLILAPPATEAQTAGKVWRIGFLSPFSSEYDTSWRVAFQQGLRDLGYVEGKHVVIEQRHAEGQLGRLADFTTTTFTPERFADYLASKSSDTTEIESRRAELEHLVAVVIPGLAQQQERLVDAVTSGVALDIVRDRLKKAETDRKGAEARRDELEAWRRDETADREQAEELRDDHPRR